jgi:hypothetical protein
MSGREAAPLGAPDGPANAGRPDVIVDFLFEDGCLLVTVENLGARPAHDVTVAFDHEFTGAGGTVKMHGLRMFRGIPFLAPRRRLVALIDSAAAYFARREPLAIVATVAWRDADGASFRQICPHDLGIYADLPVLDRT